MKKSLLEKICCPQCGSSLELKGARKEQGEIKSGWLNCAKCAKKYLIKNFIPRFVDTDKYVDNFSMEWTIHRTTQLDSAKGTEESEITFRKKTGFNGDDLRDKIVLDVGCGTGRFMEIANKYGAEVVGVDLSYAVDAAFENMGFKKGIHIIQADIFNLPLKKKSYDYIYSIGVLHHTPDTKKAFLQLPPLLKKGGEIAVWLYSWYEVLSPVSNGWRIITTRLPQRILYLFCYFIAFPLYYLARVPGLGSLLKHLFPINMHPEWRWRVLDNFDWLSPKYQWKHTYPEVFEWFVDAGLKEIEIFDPPVSVKGKKLF